LQQTTDKEKFDDLYTLLCKPSLLIQAYGNIKGNKGSLTPGVNQETVDRMSLEKINKIAEELKTNKFKFNKVKRIWIPKPKILKPGEPIKR
jgi:retron-type reverse transcriptase